MCWKPTQKLADQQGRWLCFWKNSPSRTSNAIRPLISQVVVEVRAEIQLREQVLNLFDSLGLDLSTQKNEVMRALSAHFPRTLMKKVYAVLLRELKDA